MHFHFPVLSLMNQFFRQITKPISKRIVKYASDSPIFQRYFLLIPGKFYYKLENSVKMIEREKDSAGKNDKQMISNEKAIEIGSELMMETVIFVLLASIMVLEWQRSQWTSAVQEKKFQENMNNLQELLHEVRQKMALNDRMNQTTQELLREVEKSILKKP
ncbi:PREDICTED: optic atrophy 3 protein homolog [Ceratosolen solmsi marchali]|uniref:Optic atrophy 3 protein homolog n=1 Tax=Ceratosolen solmsi marchali TaxID=326594 RepID=A0AAJ7DZI6_9HYME|nr:PREDICTED: optic atrophy 3 protein homolog [Ceratosolen solmsi marchali]